MQGEKSSIPNRYRAAVPYLAVHDAATALTFYKNAFGATEVMRLTDADGKVAHAEIKIGDAQVMLSDEHPTESVSPRQLGGTTVLVNLFVADVDALFKRALTAGATIDRPLADQFTGARNGKLKDPFGHVWLVQT